MIISVSRRTDVPAFYSGWFGKRLDAGLVQVANPYNAGQVRMVDLSPFAVDGFVFWTKNPAPFLGLLPKLEPYPWYMHCTVTPYDSGLEPGIEPKESGVIPAIVELARRVGKQRIIWRYDPILLAGEMDPRWHEQAFARLAGQLHDSVSHCVFSFYDEYSSANHRLSGLDWCVSQQARQETAVLLAGQARRYGLALYTCAQPEDYSSWGIHKSKCIDAGRLSLIGGKMIQETRDTGQREGCGCAKSVDIGRYNTCPAGCLYCYASRSTQEKRMAFWKEFPDGRDRL